MTDVQFWSIVATFVGTLGGQQVVSHLLSRGKLRSDYAAALRKELRDDNEKKDQKIEALEKRIDELKKVVDNLESTIDDLRLKRLDMWRILHQNNVPSEVLAQLRILESS